MIKTFFPQKITNGFHSSDNILINGNSDIMPSVEIITPSDPEQRGAQLSLVFSVPLTAVQEELQKRGVVVSIECMSGRMV